MNPNAQPPPPGAATRVSAGSTGAKQQPLSQPQPYHPQQPVPIMSQGQPGVRPPGAPPHPQPHPQQQQQYGAYVMQSQAPPVYYSQPMTVVGGGPAAVHAPAHRDNTRYWIIGLVIFCVVCLLCPGIILIPIYVCGVCAVGAASAVS